MHNNVDKLLETADDFGLCNELFTRILKHHGEDFDVSKCNEHEQVVLLVWQACGVIDNGGFQYLLECNFKGDPFFAKTAAAFQTIKATKCAEAMAEALSVFPNSKPPADIKARLKIYQSPTAPKPWKALREFFGKRRGKIFAKYMSDIDVKFFSESKDIGTILAKYIREHRESFRHLK